MSNRGQVVNILPTEGLNNGQEAVTIDDRQCPDCLNIRFRQDSIKKREGCNKYLATAVTTGPVTGIFELATEDGAVGVIAFAADECKRKNSTVWTSVKGSVTLSSNQNNHWQGTVHENLLVLTNNFDQLIKWAGGTNNLATLGGSPPTKAKSISEYHNYIILLNTEEATVRYRSRVRWSGLNNTESWPAANYCDLLTAGGQYGVGFGKVGDQLYVFLSGSIYQISYTGDAVTPFTFPIADPGVGAVSTNGIVSVEGGVFFASRKGIYFFNGGRAQYVSKSIEGTWRTMNAARFGYIQGIHNQRDGEVKFSVSLGVETTNTTTVVYDYLRNRWSIDSGYAANCWANLPEDTPLQPVFGDSVDGYVMTTNTGTYADGSTPVTAYAVTKPRDFGSGASRRKVSKLEVVCDSTTTADGIIRIRTAYDLQPVSNAITIDTYIGGAVWDTAVWDVDAWVGEVKLLRTMRPQGYGRLFQVEVYNNQAIGMHVAQLMAYVLGDV